MDKKVYIDRIVYYNEYKLQHNEKGPAVEWYDGDKEWWINGMYHRTDGPAIESAAATGRCRYVL